MINKMYNRDGNGWYNSAGSNNVFASNDVEEENNNEKKYCQRCVGDTDHEGNECLPCHHKRTLKQNSDWWTANSCWINSRLSKLKEETEEDLEDLEDIGKGE
jgi:hypothetical protein